MVESVTSDGPAAKAGLKTGDVIVAVADRDVQRRLDVERALIGRQAGEEVAFEIQRGGETLTLEPSRWLQPPTSIAPCRTSPGRSSESA